MASGPKYFFFVVLSEYNGCNGDPAGKMAGKGPASAVNLAQRLQIHIGPQKVATK
jgi:hypothetical protein